MKNHKVTLLTTLGLALVFIYSFIGLKAKPIVFEIPKNWPKPSYDFKNNPLTSEGFELGRKLFYDPILSRDNTISCASCHLQSTAFTHVDHDLSHGIDDKIGTRNSLTLQNLAWSKTFMWDGGVNHLDVQPLLPITSELEMDENLKNVIHKLEQSDKYKYMFNQAFDNNEITSQLIFKALSQFVVSLTSANSKYDQVKRNEASFTEMEQKGYDLFKINCASCHQEPLLSSHNFENNGLTSDPYLNDFGRMNVTQNSKDSLKFKVPTLRNIEFTFPYMHDGRFNTLNEVLKFYNSDKPKSKTLSEKLKKPMNLSDNQRTELIAFLKTLTDREFLFNPKYSYSK